MSASPLMDQIYADDECLIPQMKVAFKGSGKFNSLRSVIFSSFRGLFSSDLHIRAYIIKLFCAILSVCEDYPGVGMWILLMFMVNWHRYPKQPEGWKTAARFGVKIQSSCILKPQDRILLCLAAVSSCRARFSTAGTQAPRAPPLRIEQERPRSVPCIVHDLTA